MVYNTKLVIQRTQSPGTRKNILTVDRQIQAVSSSKSRSYVEYPGGLLWLKTYINWQNTLQLTRLHILWLYTWTCVLYSYVYSHVFYIVNQQEMNVEYSSKILKFRSITADVPQVKYPGLTWHPYSDTYLPWPFSTFYLWLKLKVSSANLLNTALLTFLTIVHANN